MRLYPLLFTALAAVALAACERSADTVEPVPVTEGMDDVSADTAPVLAPDEVDVDAGAASVSTFDCEGGHHVELVGEDSARVTLADGRVIELPRKSDGVAEYRGEALTFDIDTDGAGGVLGQDEVGGFACEPAG